MSIEARKIEFMQEFLKLQSEEAISKFEKILEKQINSDKKNIEPMSARDLNKRIDESMEDSKNGRLTKVNDLLAEIEKWS